jgi:hypothetical protein
MTRSETTPRPIVDARETLRAALGHLETVQALQRTWAMAEAHRAVAAAYRELGALASAQAMLEAALRWAHATGGGDQVVDLQCECVELLALQSDAQERQSRGSGRPARERARDLVFEATRGAARVADPQWEVTVLLRLSDVLDRFGDRDDATTLQVRALRLTMGVDDGAGPRPVAGPSGRH